MVAGLPAITLLALCAASLVMFGSQVAGEWAIAFSRTNALEPLLRTRLIGGMLGSSVLVGLAGVIYAQLGGVRAVVALDRASRLMAPVAIIGLVPAIIDTTAWQDPFFGAMAFAGFTILFERLLRVALGAWEEWKGPGIPGARVTLRSGRGLFATGIVLAATVTYAVYMSKYTLYAHRRFQTYNFDLGQYDNVFWNALHGRPLVCTPLGAFKNWSSFSSHADLGVYFLLPFYALRPNAETLLILQAGILALGAIPLYLFAARRLPLSYACTLAVCYLLYPPMHGSNFYDFHFQPVAATFVLFTIWLVDARRWIWLTLAFIVAISCREDISVGLTLLGIYLLLSGHRPRAGAIMAGASALYFVVLRFQIMPSFGPGWFSDIYKDLYPQPKGPLTYGGVMQTLMTNPAYVFRTLLTSDKLRYFLQIVTPVAFLPLRKSFLLPALVPGFIFTLLTTGYPPTTDIAFQYSGHFTPYIFAASAVALATYRADRDLKARAAVAALVVGTFLCTSHWGAFPPNGRARGGFAPVDFTPPTAADLQKGRDLVELAAMIPEEAMFGVSEQEMPHVSGRLKVVSMRGGPGDSEYLLYGTASEGAPVGDQALASGLFVEVARRPGVVLLKRKK